MAALKGVPQRPHFTPRQRANESWQEDAACHSTDPEAFFPDASATITAGARRVCGRCPVRAACLEYALTQGEWHGIWGGLSVEQRRALVREQKAVNA